MSTNTKRQYNIKEQGNASIHPQHGVARESRADGVEYPFPTKPVSHTRPFKHRTVTQQPRGPVSAQEHHPNGNREIAGSQHQRKDLHRLLRGELQMTKAIHEKELMLQAKLWSVEEKLRHKIQKDRREDAAGDDEKTHEDKRGRGQPEGRKAETTTRLSEQHSGEVVRSREMLIQENRQDNAKQHGRRQDQPKVDRRRNTREEEGVRGRRTEVQDAECPRSQGKANDSTARKEKVSEEQHNSRWEDVKEHSRKNGHEKDQDTNRTDVDLRPQGGGEKAKEQKKADSSWTGEKKEGRPQMTADRLETKSHRGADGEISSPPAVSSRRQEEKEEELGLMESSAANLQLLPCSSCKRKFASDRLEKHVQICHKTKQSHRKVFNSYAYRTKGSALEEYLKTHSRGMTPEKKKPGQNNKAQMKNVQRGLLPAGTSYSKWSK